MLINNREGSKTDITSNIFCDKLMYHVDIVDSNILSRSWIVRRWNFNNNIKFFTLYVFLLIFLTIIFFTLRVPIWLYYNSIGRLTSQIIISEAYGEGKFSKDLKISRTFLLDNVIRGIHSVTIPGHLQNRFQRHLVDSLHLVSVGCRWTCLCICR